MPERHDLNDLTSKKPFIDPIIDDELTEALLHGYHFYKGMQRRECFQLLLQDRTPREIYAIAVELLKLPN